MEQIKDQQEISARRLLKRLRNVMVQEISVQEKLDKIVEIVAAELHTEVCSFYFLQPGDILELFASYGLKPEAVHETTLRMGEGLIGEIAIQKKALSFTDVWQHPSFVYKPETGEKLFKSLMGVPVLKGSQVLGVLAVQTEETHIYDEDEIEILETVAMVLAQMLISVDFKAKDNHAMKPKKDMQARLEGVRLASGMAVGKAFIPSRVGRVVNVVSSYEGKELKRLTVALDKMDK